MPKDMEEGAKEWGVSGRVTWIGLALTYLLLLRASELFTEDDGRVHAVYGLSGGDVAFYEGERQVEEGSSPEVDTVEVWFRGSKGGQDRRGAVLVRTRGDRGTGGETVELMQELYRIHDGRSDLPLMANGSHGGWKVWTRGQAIYYLRRGLSVVATARGNREGGGKARLVPEEFALHSGRIGGATRLAAKGASSRVIQQEGRWSSNAFMVYVRANMEEPQWVSEALSGEKGSKRLPGQGTRRGYRRGGCSRNL